MGQKNKTLNGTIACSTRREQGLLLKKVYHYNYNKRAYQINLSYKILSARVRDWSEVWTYPGRGAAGPLCGWDLTARVLLGAVKFPRAVTWYVRVALGASRLGLHHFALREGEDEHIAVLLLACSSLHVAGVALRTAVLMVCTANRLKGRQDKTLVSDYRLLKAVASVTTFKQFLCPLTELLIWTKPQMYNIKLHKCEKIRLWSEQRLTRKVFKWDILHEHT